MQNSVDNDTELVQNLVKDDIAAFDALYERYASRLYIFVYKYLRSKDDSEELVQSVFVKVWENRKNLKEEYSFKSYLFTIAYNDICKIFRKRKYLQSVVEEILYNSTEYHDETCERIDNKSVLERVKQIIKTLPYRQREVFVMSKLQNMPTKEIAVIVKLSPGTVDNYVSWSLKFIKDKLAKEEL